MSIYKDCDIRGIFGKEFDETEGYKIGRAIGSIHKNAVLAVAGDVRLSTPVLKENLIRGLQKSGVHVVDLGILATPMFYFALDGEDIQGGIMVTASHNPPEYNGFKLMFGDMPITAQEIREIERLVKEQKFTDGQGSCEKRNITGAYEAFIKERFSSGKKSLKLVMDCCDGTTSAFYPDIAESLGYEVVRLYCGTDGSFPNRNPNPALYTCLKDLCQRVRETGADLGAGYDGDGDRVVFVDDQGQVLCSEESFVIFIKAYMEKYQKGQRLKNVGDKELTPSFVYDQKSMGIVKKTIEEYGGTALIEKSGYGFIKKRFLENRSIMGGEISGHFFFGEIGRDDGLFATLKMCGILEETGRPLSDLRSEIPPSYISPELRIFCAYKDQEAVLQKAKHLAQEYPWAELDGVRIEFPCGWFLIRKSVTEEAMTMRMEGDSKEALSWMKEKVREAIPEVGANPYFQ